MSKKNMKYDTNQETDGIGTKNEAKVSLYKIKGDIIKSQAHSIKSISDKNIKENLTTNNTILDAILDKVEKVST